MSLKMTGAMNKSTQNCETKCEVLSCDYSKSFESQEKQHRDLSILYDLDELFHHIL
ncbi:hypothetical protein PM8797T_02434 [Gimesia maris DSM 8797]|nr:hypothetical protein PM8797T_02434 [Gimesia maris DSM 8797]